MKFHVPHLALRAPLGVVPAMAEERVDRYGDGILARDARLIGSRVEIANGDRVGTVEAVARTPAGRSEALRVGLDSGKTVWIDGADIRFNRLDRIVMINLDRTDLLGMADRKM